METKYSRNVVKNLEDEDKLKDVVLSCDDFNVRAMACANPNLADESFLRQVALNDDYESVRIACLQNPNFTDEDALIKIALNDSHYLVRREAINNINDEKSLVQIARNDSVKSIKFAACRRLKDIFPESIYLADSSAIDEIEDEDVLIDIAKNSLISSSRNAALKRIHDDSTLYDAVLHENKGNISSGAIVNISDGTLLEDIVLNDDDLQNRLAVLRNPNFSNESILEDLALNDDDYEIRKAAAENPNFTNIDKLAEIYNAEKEYHVRQAIMGRIKAIAPYSIYVITQEQVKKVDDNEILLDIANTSLVFPARLQAISQITDCKILKGFILDGDSDARFKIIALRNPNFNDLEVLKQICAGDEDEDIKSIACERLNAIDEE